MPNSTMDPTSRGDMKADLMRRWYEANRESWWDRCSLSTNQQLLSAGCADDFALGIMNEAGRIASLSDAALSKEVGGDGE